MAESDDVPDDPGSVTEWIRELKTGDAEAARQLWDRYFRRLVALARARLERVAHQGGDADEEDAALSAFHSLCEGAARGRFDQLGDRDDLWKLLVVITTRKAIDMKQREGRKKRGGGRVLSEAALADDRDDGPPALDQVFSEEPTPQFAAMIAEEFQKRLDSLDKDELRKIALMRLQGYGNEEIAQELGCALRTVARRLELIRELWGAA
jgi:RNA polymerase sigma factor (sigma-70 family)